MQGLESNYAGPIGLVAVWLLLVGGISEAARQQGFSPELTRKVVHIGAGHVILLAWWFMLPPWMGIGASALFSAVALVSYRLPILPGINSVGRRSWGTFFYAVSIGVVIAYYWPLGQPYYGVIGILTMCWGDGLAALVGQRWGRHGYELLGEKKSWEGSLTMAAVSMVVVFLVLSSVYDASWELGLVTLGVAIASTVLEAFSKYGIDNLTVPLGAAAVAALLSSWI